MPPLHAKSSGTDDAPVVVLLHGLFGSAANWGTVARRLADRYRVLVPDLRNHGRSPHDPDHSYPAMAADLLQLLDEQGIGSAIWVGHSMGGKAAMHLALNHPDRVRALAVVDMSPVRYSHDFAAVLRGFAAVDLAGIRDRAEADAQMAVHVLGDGVRSFLLQNLVKDTNGWAWRLNIAALAAAQGSITDFPAQPLGARFKGPTSFIYGELSDYVKPDYEAEIMRLFPSARLCPVAAAGHWVYADQPQGFMRCLEAFLRNAA